MQRRTIILVPGYNEPPDHFDILQHGKDGIAGLTSYGFSCVTFPQQDDDLRDRIDRFAEHLTDLRNRGHAFPVVTLGYSLGGLVTRGFLRAYPERSHEVSHTVMIATPNWGVTTLAMPHITRMLRIPDKAMGDMALHSDFMRWYNGTGGRWEHVRDKRNKIWKLDNEPIVGPPGARMLAIMGQIPKRGGDNDGLVWSDSATLGGRIPAHFIEGPHCNHMNIIGHYDAMMFLTKGFMSNDNVWPLTLAAILDFTEATAA